MGCRGWGPQILSDTIHNGYVNAGQNALANLRDPVFKIDPTNSANNYDPFASNVHAGMAREKDGFILIAAGADRLYGISDDIVAPGSLLQGQ